MASQLNTQQNKDADEISVVILGRTGSGKSSIGNLLLGEKKFVAKASMSSQTKKCQAATRKSAPGLPAMRVVDTPGTIDTRSGSNISGSELIEAIKLSPSGFDAFLLVVRADVAITKERELFANLVRLFDEELYQYSIVVFTHGDAVDEDEDEDAFINEQRGHPDNEFIDQLLNNCDNRCVMMDARSGEEINNLHDIINFLREKNQNKKYTNRLFDQASDQLRERPREMPDLQNQQVSEKEDELKEVSKLKKRKEEKVEKMQKELDRLKEEIRRTQIGQLSNEIHQLCRSQRQAAHGGSGNARRLQLLQEFSATSMASQPNTQQNTDADEISVVILGKTGSGKSSIGNRLLGENKFDAKVKDESLRDKKCMAETRKSDQGLPAMRVVDTPGTIDTGSKDQAIRELSEAITLSPSGFDAFLLVVRADGRITQEEEEALAGLVRVFGKELYRFSIVVFTHEDAAKDKRAGITKLMRQAGNEFIYQLLEICGARGAWVMMDARSPREAHSLQQKITKLRRENKREKYRNRLFEQASHQLREMMEQILPHENKINKVKEEMQALEEREQQLGPTSQ